MNLMKKLIQSILPDGPQPGGQWDDKYNGADLEKFITGLSGQYNRDMATAKKLQNALNPALTEFIPELEAEFLLPPADMTDAERRGRVDGRFRVMAETKLRKYLMEYLFVLSGFTGVTFRTLGSNGVHETPFDFFEDVGLAYYNAAGAVYGSDDAIYGATESIGGAELITNGGSAEYSLRGNRAVARLKSESWYHGSYYVVEDPYGEPLQIEKRQYETFWDLLYLVKPAGMHGLLRAEYI